MEDDLKRPGRADILTTTTKALDHILTGLFGEPLLALENDDGPALDRARLNESLADHVPRAITRLNSRLFASLAVTEDGGRENASFDF